MKKKSPFPVMANMTVKLVREYLKDSKSIIIPLGVVEQHGYHLPLQTDALIATHTARRLGEATGILVAPTIYQSFSGGGLPGTINISPAVMSQVVGDTLLSLAAQGFRKFYLWLCHGGSENARALGDALRLLLRMNPAFADALIALLPIWKFDPNKIGWKRALKDHDWHAGWLETSMVMALAPELVRMEDMELDEKRLLELQIQHPDNYQHAEKIVDDECVIPRMTQRPDIRVGAMGYPQKASAALGRRIVRDTVKSAAAKILDLEKRADGIYREVKFVPEPLILT